MEPLKQFICDSCHQLIEKPEDGWVEWLSHYDEGQNKIVSSNFRICHHEMRCQKLANHEHCSDWMLADFLYADKGMTLLTNFIDDGFHHAGDYKGPQPDDMRQFLDFFRRLTLPYYEEARQHWQQALSEGYFDDMNSLNTYFPSNLKKMIEHYE